MNEDKNIKKDNFSKVSKLNLDDLKSLFTETGAPELELFDIQLTDENGKINSFIRKIDNECGVFRILKPSLDYEYILNSDLEIQHIENIILPDTPTIKKGCIIHSCSEITIKITDIYLKSGFIIIFYETLNN